MRWVTGRGCAPRPRTAGRGRRASSRRVGRRPRLSSSGTRPSGPRREDGAVSERPEEPARPRRSRARLLLSVAALVLALDVGTKLLVVATLSDREPMRLLGGA